MKGLIFENFYLLRKQFILASILLSICGVAAYFSSPFVFMGMSTMLVSMMPITVMVYELEESRMMKIISTMAVSKKEIVLSKYILTNVLSLLCLFINFIFLVISTKQILLSLFSSLAIFFLGVIVIEIMLPLIFKYGVEKGRTLLLVIIMVLGSIVTLLLKIGINVTPNLITIIVIAVPTIYILMNFISYFISLKIFEKSEL